MYHRRVPPREHVFVLSLKYHGYRVTYKRKNLKYRRGYVIPATQREDATGVDFWVKPPRCDLLLPVQVTQRGTRLARLRALYSSERRKDLDREAEARLWWKRLLCRRNGIVFVLVKDYRGLCTNPRTAWSDIKELRHGIQEHTRRLP